MKGFLIVAALACVSTLALANIAKAATPNWDGTVGEFLAYCDSDSEGCAFAIDTVLNQSFWGHVVDRPCQAPPDGYQIDDGKVLIVNWLRANSASSSPVIDSLGDAAKALEPSLCAPQ